MQQGARHGPALGQVEAAESVERRVVRVDHEAVREVERVRLAAQRTVPGAGIGGGALGVSGLQVQEVARRDERQVQLQAALDGPAVLVGRTPARTRARDRGVGGGDVEGVRSRGSPQRGEGDVRRDRRDGERRHEAVPAVLLPNGVRKAPGKPAVPFAAKTEPVFGSKLPIWISCTAPDSWAEPQGCRGQGADEVGHAVALHHVDQARDGRQAGHRIEGHAHRRRRGGMPMNTLAPLPPKPAAGMVPTRPVDRPNTPPWLNTGLRRAVGLPSRAWPRGRRPASPCRR